MSETLKGIERPKFDVGPRSVREHFQGMYDRRKAMVMAMFQQLNNNKKD